jgi:hypothetical protein
LIEHVYDILGGTVTIQFPYCCFLNEIMCMVGSDHMAMLEKIFGVRCVSGDDWAERLLRKHTSIVESFIARPWIMQRGRHRYYCLRDLARNAVKSYCFVCGARTRDYQIDREYPGQAWSLRRQVGEGRDWVDADYIYFCSPGCLKKQRALESYRLRRQEKKKEIERTWLKKARTKLNECRKLTKKLQQV